MKDDLDDFLGRSGHAVKSRETRLERFVDEIFNSRLSSFVDGMKALDAVMAVKRMVESNSEELGVAEILPIVYSMDFPITGVFYISWSRTDLERLTFAIKRSPRVAVDLRWENND
jgi:hypothetical protein